MKAADNKLSGFLWIIAIILFLSIPVTDALARMVTQLIPTLTISEEFSDNYFNTENDTFEEWITSYELGFSLGFLSKTSQIYLEYAPEYKDYKNLDDRDGFTNNGSLSAAIQPTKFTTINANMAYDGHDGNNAGESWEHSAGASIRSQLTETINAYISQDYSKSYDQQLRTGDYKEHETNTTEVGMMKKFGAKNSLGLNFTYEFDDYSSSDADAYTSYEPSAFMRYWFTRLDGMEVNLGYQDKEFDLVSDNDYTTMEGDVRYIRKLSKHLDAYIKYRQYIADRKDGDHQIFHPSVGIDWDITDDSGISIGLGVLFHKWDNDNDDSEEPFIDLDAYKVFNFSPKGSLSVTGSSTYEESGEEAASLGYNILYRAGFSLDYQFTKQLSSNLFGSYQLQDFQEDLVNRKDYTGEIGGGLTWNLLKWLQLSARASHTNFNSDDALRQDYEENKITFFIRFIPEQPIRPEKMFSRKTLEDKIFED